MYTVLITGASRGLGAAIAKGFSKEKYKILTPTRMELNLNSGNSIEKYLSKLEQDVDVIVNDAGINKIAELDDITQQDIEDTLKVNLVSPFRLIQALAPKMKANRFGRIVNISSIWSVVSRFGRGSYTLSKAALNGMTRSIALELAPYNILVNAVAPGYIMTDLTIQNNTAAELKRIEKSIPLQRLAQPSEIASIVLFLCSEQNTYITGQTIIADGGYTCQ